MNCRRLIATLSATVFLLLAALPLSAADKPAAAADPGSIIYPANSGVRAEAASSHGSGYGGILVVAALLAGAGGWLFWRGRLAPGGTVPLRKLAVAETKSLGNRQYLVVAAYENKKYLLGVCPGRIELLTALDETPPGKSP